VDLSLNGANNKYWVGFSRVKGIGAARTKLLLEHFGDLAAAWIASESELRQAGLSAKIIQAFLEVRKTINLDFEIEKIQRLGISILTLEDPQYPKKLLSIEFPPPVLYFKGTIEERDEYAIAVVGTRHITSYGRQVAGELGRFLAQNNVTVISGLARGVDAVAHEAALNAGGRTLAVLGSGVDVIYPPEHRSLAERVIANGAVISDYYPGTPPEGVNFPPRNRIISGLSMATVIVEAGERSGAMITAEFAATQGREVFAVPGSIYALRSKGTNRLIRDGALPLLDFGDLLEALNLKQVDEYRYAKKVLPENDIELLLMETLKNEPLHIDEIKATLGLPMEKISAALVMMKLKGLVKETDNLTYLSIGEVEQGYEG
jgi:DNA processing protein